MKNIFTEIKDGIEVFSWRKAGTALNFIIFATACLGNLIKHDFNELPNSYLLIIGGVFAFYFGKRFFEDNKIKVEKKPQAQQKQQING